MYTTLQFYPTLPIDFEEWKWKLTAQADRRLPNAFKVRVNSGFDCSSWLLLSYLIQGQERHFRCAVRIRRVQRGINTLIKIIESDARLIHVIHRANTGKAMLECKLAQRRRHITNDFVAKVVQKAWRAWNKCFPTPISHMWWLNSVPTFASPSSAQALMPPLSRPNPTEKYILYPIRLNEVVRVTLSWLLSDNSMKALGCLWV